MSAPSHVEFLQPNGFVAVIQNSRGDFVVIGDADGRPFTTHQAANEFADAFKKAMPFHVNVATVPIQPSGLDVDAETND